MVAQPANPGPAEIHDSVDGGASQLQMALLGSGHHPRCHHYEWGPCTCRSLYAKEACVEDDSRSGDDNLVPFRKRSKPVTRWQRFIHWLKTVRKRMNT